MKKNLIYSRYIKTDYARNVFLILVKIISKHGRLHPVLTKNCFDLKNKFIVAIKQKKVGLLTETKLRLFLINIFMTI